MSGSCNRADCHRTPGPNLSAEHDDDDDDVSSVIAAGGKSESKSQRDGQESESAAAGFKLCMRPTERDL